MLGGATESADSIEARFRDLAWAADATLPTIRGTVLTAGLEPAVAAHNVAQRRQQAIDNYVALLWAFDLLANAGGGGWSSPTSAGRTAHAGRSTGWGSCASPTAWNWSWTGS